MKTLNEKIWKDLVHPNFLPFCPHVDGFTPISIFYKRPNPQSIEMGAISLNGKFIFTFDYPTIYPYQLYIPLVD